MACIVLGVITVIGYGSPALADPVRDAQWQLDFLNVAEAHKYSQGEGVVVAVVDTGVDGGHPDLAGSLLPGKDFTSDGGDAQKDVDGHGTGMVGLVVAHGRAQGLAPRATVLPVRFHQNVLPGQSAAPAIAWAVDNGAEVLSLSFGGKQQPDVRSAIERAIAKDIVVVAAVGNEGEVDPGLVYPAAYPGVVGAVGVDRNGNHAQVSVVSSAADLAAPAVDVGSTDIRVAGHTGYRSGTGTSDSTAIIAGAAALVRAKYPNLSAAEVIHRLTATADDKGAPGRDDEYGYGVINLVRALTADVPPLQPSGTPTTGGTAAAPGGDDDGGVSGRTIAVVGALTLIAVLAAAFVTIALRRRSP